MRRSLWTLFRLAGSKKSRPYSTTTVLGHATPDTRFKKVKTLSFGQPTFQSHPEFFNCEAEILPGITEKELRERRSSALNLAHQLVLKHAEETKDVDHLMIIPSSSKKYMTENIPYPFRQNSNFFYLSGSYDMDSFLLLISSGGVQKHFMILSDPDPVGDLWDGPKTSPKAAVEHFGFDDAFLLSEFPLLLKKLCSKERNHMVWCEDRKLVDKFLLPEPREIKVCYIESPKAILDTLRVIKTPAEINLMRRTCDIASEAFQQALAYCGSSSSVTEHQIWAKLDYECRVRGAERLAYPPVVASGPRANVIHYVFNANRCKPEEMVLVDAGCEFFGYCSDITRTWPVSGSFTDDRHRSLYEMLLNVQCELIDLVQPGPTLDQLFRTMGTKLMQGLQELGVVSKSLDSHSRNFPEIALRFCPHHVSHYLGMDVHDTSTVERNERLRSGMIITVEPGIYIRSNSAQRDFLTKAGREFEGVAIRIEDDVLVTDSGREVLTINCPKSIQDIESWTGKRRATT